VREPSPLTPLPEGEGVALIADAHLGGPGGEPGPLLAQLEALPAAGCERLILMGDLFHVFVGFPQFETAEIRAVVPAIAAVRARGILTHYIEGNRDFFLRGSLYERAFAVEREVAFTAAGRRCLAIHGDGLNDRDRQYLFWRWLSKSWPVRLLVKYLPAAAARRFVHSTERRLAATNFKHRAAIPEHAIRAYAERRLAEGHDLMIVGHFHEERRWTVTGGEVWLLEAWFSSRRVEWLRD
jgi:UDP-2,3-diacylglucosamine pyrophosphatase LpxH